MTMSAKVRISPEKVRTAIMIPMTPTVAPIFRLSSAPPRAASRSSFGPIRVSLLIQLTTTQETMPVTAAKPAEYPKSISTVMTTSGRI